MKRETGKMSRKRKTHKEPTPFQVLEFETTVDNKESLGEGTEKVSNLREKAISKPKAKGKQLNYLGKLDVGSSTGGGRTKHDSEDKVEANEDLARVGRKRKKRKRKPRNNKYEGMSKKLTDEIEIQNVQTVCQESRHRDTQESQSESILAKVGSYQSKGSNIGTELAKDHEEHTSTKMRTNKKRKKVGKDKVNAKKQRKADGDEDDDNQIETREGVNGKKSEMKFRNPVVSEQTDIIYVSKKRQKRRDQIWKNSREAWGHQLKSARFRFINETLYKSSGHESFKQFKGNKSLFQVYHDGFNQQIQQWPENPVDVIIKYLNNRPQNCIVADFGCGEAKIAQSVKQKVHSFDIFPANERVTVCNISKVPLKSESLDVAVYCLSLMGINWIDYLREAHRVLKPGTYRTRCFTFSSLERKIHARRFRHRFQAF
ncbi:uncharacterized protein [Apostichopus japonicus]|uniref:uncharacterized protein isoform X2 n=1 Tax=Stichopus japonicus TaxID=307972 RepID=UPI003AB7FD6C